MATCEQENNSVQGEQSGLHLLSLPLEILEKTFSFLDFEEISNNRIVCKAFDKVCQQRLNQGFSSSEKLHGQIYKEIKAKLPRRESERRSHPLARHMDLLAALETRLSLLAMTYIKYMEMGVCCFIPGKVLDEINNILQRIRHDATPPRPHELLTELRDISSMAMEHFEEKIVPIVKSRLMRQDDADVCTNSGERGSTSCLVTYRGSPTTSTLSPTGFQLPIPPSPPNPVMHSRIPPLRMEIVQLRNSLRSTSSTVVSLRKEVGDYKAIVQDQHKKMLDQDKKINALTRAVTDIRKALNDREKLIVNLQNTVLRLDNLKGVDSSNKIIKGLADSDDTDDTNNERNLSPSLKDHRNNRLVEGEKSDEVEIGKKSNHGKRKRQNYGGHSSQGIMGKKAKK